MGSAEKVESEFIFTPTASTQSAIDLNTLNSNVTTIYLAMCSMDFYQFQLKLTEERK